MANISSNELARELLRSCLQEQDWPEALLRDLVGLASSTDPRIARQASRDFFSIVVERLADLFEPAFCETYVRLFTAILAMADSGISAGALRERYTRVRQPRMLRTDPPQIFVLSRITLGADVAVTSVMLDGLKRRFPRARICFAGPQKNWELFAADPRIEYRAVAYSRGGTLAERLQTRPDFPEADSIVVDPDSRLTQLGLLPICPDDRYYFFESRAYGGSSSLSLPELAARWMEETFEIAGSRAYIATQRGRDWQGTTVSFGVGENEEKRIGDPFERRLLEELRRRAAPLLIDKGGGGAEGARVEAAIAGVAEATAFEGSYAAFADLIAQSSLYAGYDSAGQHVAAACGVPLLSIFAGYASDRMFARWRPYGSGHMDVIQVPPGEAQADAVLARVRRSPLLGGVAAGRASELAEPLQPRKSERHQADAE